MITQNLKFTSDILRQSKSIVKIRRRIPICNFLIHNLALGYLPNLWIVEKRCKYNRNVIYGQDEEKEGNVVDHNGIKKYIPKACPIPLQRRSIIRIYYHFRDRVWCAERKRGYPSSRGIRRRRLRVYTLSLPLLCKGTVAISLGENAIGNKSDNVSRARAG